PTEVEASAIPHALVGDAVEERRTEAQSELAREHGIESNDGACANGHAMHCLDRPRIASLAADCDRPTVAIAAAQAIHGAMNRSWNHQTATRENDRLRHVATPEWVCKGSHDQGSGSPHRKTLGVSLAAAWAAERVSRADW